VKIGIRFNNFKEMTFLLIRARQNCDKLTQFESAELDQFGTKPVPKTILKTKSVQQGVNSITRLSPSPSRLGFKTLD
jgi:hypothetical protein